MASAHKTKGEIKEVLGAVTGDRQVEAEGRVEQRVADPDNPVAAVSDPAIDAEERAVKKDHHDLPVGDPQRRGPLGT